MKKNEFLHGGDYNPEQWFMEPDIFTNDLHLMKKLGINVVTLGVFSWSVYQPCESVWNIGWLLPYIDRLYEEKIHVILATPTGGKPPWLSNNYSEVNRVNEDYVRERFGNRHSHCMSSKVFRSYVSEVNTRLSKVYGNHPGIIMWHISNEYFGHCYCDLCLHSFQTWLQAKYKDINVLNNEWNRNFWSHTFTCFDEIPFPGKHSEVCCTAHLMDFERFTTDLTLDFFNHEKSAILQHSSKPVTTNFWGGAWMHLDYAKFANHLDIVSYDAYPNWHSSNDYYTALDIHYMYDFMRSLKKENWLLMESTPSTANWCEVSKLKRPKMHELSEIQAISAGSDMVGYFQFRQSMVNCEKYHSAVIGWSRNENTRIQKDVKAVSDRLIDFKEILNSTPESEVAIFFDRNNKFALENNKGPRNKDIKYQHQCETYYRVLKEFGLNVDIITDVKNMKYKFVIIPSLYAASSQVWESIHDYVKAGGIILTTVLSGLANENDCIEPMGSHEVYKYMTGLKFQEIDALYDSDTNTMKLNGKLNELKYLCELNEVIDADVVGTYNDDFYKGYPAFSKKVIGNGTAYHLGSVGTLETLKNVVGHILTQNDISYSVTDLLVQERSNSDYTYTFYFNYHETERRIVTDSAELFYGTEIIEPYGYTILKKERG